MCILMSIYMYIQYTYIYNVYAGRYVLYICEYYINMYICPVCTCRYLYSIHTLLFLLVCVCLYILGILCTYMYEFMTIHVHGYIFTFTLYMYLFFSYAEPPICSELPSPPWDSWAALYLELVELLTIVHIRLPQPPPWCSWAAPYLKFKKLISSVEGYPHLLEVARLLFQAWLPLHLLQKGKIIKLF